MKQISNNIIEIGDLVCFADSDKEEFIKETLGLFVEEKNGFIIIYEFKRNAKRKYHRDWCDYLSKI
jgi:hypothetical protein